MNDPLFTNKLAAAGLTALLLIFGIPIITHMLMDHGGHQEEGWPFPHFPEMDLGVEGAAAAVEEVIDLGTLLANANAASGERKSALCASCHTFNEGGANGTGPNLWNVVGREVGGVAGFNYSPAVAGFGGVWTFERLDGYLKNSQSYLPGTSMVQRIAKDTQRADILAYLQTLSSSPVPFPAPAVAEEPVAAVEAAAEDASGVVDQVVDAVEETVDTVVDVAEDTAEAVEDVVEEATDELD